jgi:hypothetical protein
VPIVNAFLSRKNKPETDFVYLPIVYQYTAMSAILDAKTADFIEIIEADTGS